MTIDEAIRIHTLYLRGSDEVEPVDFDKAIRLGIEALELIQDIRIRFPTMPNLSLPSEGPIPDLSPSADRKQLLRESNLGRESGQ